MHSELPGSFDCYLDVDALVSLKTTAFPASNPSPSIPPPCVFPFPFAPSAEAAPLPEPMMDNEAYRARPTATQTEIIMAENMRLREEVEVLRQCLRIASTLHESGCR
jgi:hypothetical protein